MAATAYIIDVVNKLVEKYGTRNPYELCRALGIKIHYIDMQKKLKGFFFYKRLDKMSKRGDVVRERRTL